MPDQTWQQKEMQQTGSQDMPTLSVVGLGKLGSPMAAVFAGAGYKVIGTDLNPIYVDAIERGIAPVEETDLQIFIERAKQNLSATSDIRKAVRESQITFIIVPTPCDDQGLFSNDFVLSAVEMVGKAIREKATYHLVVITSTVVPGTTGGVVADRLVAAAGRPLGETMGLCYSPEFIALGSVIQDMLNPDFILIGESDELAGDKLEAVYRATCNNSPAYRRMNFVCAELSKIAVNTFVTTKISYANMLADMCSNLPGADVDVVTDAVGADSRIGVKYLKGAVSYGGPCFPRDNKAFSAFGQKLGVACDLAVATDALNRQQAARLVGAVEAKIAPGGTVAVLGLSYKPGTYVVEESAGVDLSLALLEAGYQVIVHDPMAADEAKKFLPASVTISGDYEGAVGAADLCVITTPWADYRNVAKLHEAKVVIDPWRFLSKADIREGVDYVPLGRR